MLRVFLAAAPDRDRTNPWVRYGADGRVTSSGNDAPGQWPADSALEVVLAAAPVRLAVVDLPPMPPNRLRQAARFALEDQMAAGAEEAAIAVAPSGRSTIAAIASRALIDSVATHERRVARIVPESALAPRNPGWTWCVSGTGDSFVRREDGSAFAVGAAHDDDLPVELQAALAQARRAGTAPAVVHSAKSTRPDRLAQWSQATGVPFVAAAPWRWEDAAPAAFAAAPDFLGIDASSQSAGTISPAVRMFRPAMLLGALALALHVGASLAQWAWLATTDWRLSRQMTALAANAGLPAGSPAVAAAAIARRNAELRHAAAKPAPADPLPLMARAAHALGELPQGSLRSASYTDDGWTLELGKLDADATSSVMRALGRAGVDTVAAPTSSGIRMRMTLDAAAR
jgi:type II secretion system protein L